MVEAQKLEYLKVFLNIPNSDTSQDVVLTQLLDMSLLIGLSIVFPFHKDRTNLKLPKQYEFWDVLCAKELYDKKDFASGMKSYSENGISFGLEEAQGLLSYGLIGQLVPKARVPE